MPDVLGDRARLGRPSRRPRRPASDLGCWTLGVRCSMFDVRDWEASGGTGVEISDLTQFVILTLLLIFKPQEITIMRKSKIKRRRIAKHLCNSKAVGPGAYLVTTTKRSEEFGSLSSPTGGEGLRGGGLFYLIPLSPSLSPLVPRGARERKREYRNSTSVTPVLPRGRVGMRFGCRCVVSA